MWKFTMQTIRMILCSFAILLLVLFPLDGAEALSPKKRSTFDPMSGWHLRAAFAGSFNNLGVQLLGEGGYRWRLYSHTSPAFRDNFFKLGATAVITPATLAAGPVLRLQPTSFLILSVAYIYRFYLPAFSGGTLYKDMNAVEQRFQGVTSFSDGQERNNAQRDDVIARNNGRVVFGAHLLRFGATLQLRFKGVLALINTRLYLLWAPFDDVDKSDLYYEAAYDVMVKKQDQLFDMLAAVGYQWSRFRFLATASYTISFQTQETRLGFGPAVQWTITDRWRTVTKPSLLLIVRWWAQHRFRAGPIPNIAVVFESQFQ